MPNVVVSSESLVTRQNHGDFIREDVDENELFKSGIREQRQARINRTLEEIEESQNKIDNLIANLTATHQWLKSSHKMQTTAALSMSSISLALFLVAMIFIAYRAYLTRRPPQVRIIPDQCTLYTCFRK